jgi:hypothetical protein
MGRPNTDRVIGVGAGFFREPFRVADAFGADENTFGIHAGEDVAKALAFLADQRVCRDPHVIEKHFGRRMVHHSADRPDGQAVILHLAHVEQKHRVSVGAFFDLVARRRARQQQHQIGIFGPRRPDFLAIDDIIIALKPGGGFQRGGIRAAGRLCHAEGLQAQRTAGDLRQVQGFLGRTAVQQHRAHDVYLRMTGSTVAAGALNLLQNRSGG